MGQALYRKYRSKSFSDVVGQEHITTTLKRALKTGRISHAYLFTGPRGVGKTSVARILAHEVNALPYTDESIHLDIIEIDAASNRRIDEIRDLRDKVRISPTSAKYKVYIIDEVHMLTKEAFNALLKTLEEPPAHCIFILATTEAHKLPETIVSRTQRFEFKPIEPASAAKHLGNIAHQEKIDIDSNALMLLAEHGRGSFRDSISLLDQLSSISEKITEQTVASFLGLPNQASIDQLGSALRDAQTPLILQALDELQKQGVNPSATATMLAKNLRQSLIDNNQSWIPPLLRELLSVSASIQPQTALEIALLESASLRAPSSEITPPRLATEPKRVEAEPPAIVREIKTPPAKKTGSAVTLDENSWTKITELVKAKAASLYTALRLATPVIEGSKLILSFEFPLHQKKVNQAKHKDIIAQAVSEVLNKEYSIETEIKQKDEKDQKDQEVITSQSTKPELQTISNIFGPAEVLES